jgi:hypothetical protein
MKLLVDGINIHNEGLHDKILGKFGLLGCFDRTDFCEGEIDLAIWCSDTPISVVMELAKQLQDQGFSVGFKK